MKTTFFVYCCIGLFMTFVGSCTLFNIQRRDAVEVHSESEKKKIAFLEKYRWKLIQINGELPSTSPARLTFNFAKNHFSGNGGCNQIFGDIELEDGTLKFSQIASTEMACMDTEVKQQEEAFLRILDKGIFQFDIAEQTLNLYRDRQLVLMFGLLQKD